MGERELLGEIEPSLARSATHKIGCSPPPSSATALRLPSRSGESGTMIST